MEVQVEVIDESSTVAGSTMTKKKNIYLLDFSSIDVTQLEKIIFSSDENETRVFCFCQLDNPKISLSSLQHYAKWLVGGSLQIINVTANTTDASDSILHTITFFASRISGGGKYPQNEWNIHILSRKEVLRTVAELLIAENYEVNFNISKTYKNPDFYYAPRVYGVIKACESEKVRNVSDLQAVLLKAGVQKEDIVPFVNHLKKSNWITIKNDVVTINWTSEKERDNDEFKDTTSLSSSSSHKKRHTPYVGNHK